MHQITHTVVIPSTCWQKLLVQWIQWMQFDKLAKSLKFNTTFPPLNLKLCHSLFLNRCIKLIKSCLPSLCYKMCVRMSFLWFFILFFCSTHTSHWGKGCWELEGQFRGDSHIGSWTSFSLRWRSWSLETQRTGPKPMNVINKSSGKKKQTKQKTNPGTNMNMAAVYSITIVFSRKSSVPRIKCIMFKALLFSAKDLVSWGRGAKKNTGRRKIMFNHISPYTLRCQTD